MEIMEEVKVVRYVEFDGMRFYEDSKGYWLGQQIGVDGKPHRIRLHVYVWEKYNGPVPDGYDIHHIDHNRDNNEIENLVAMPRSEHHKLHMAERDKDELAERLNLLARPKAAEWHKSDAGREWHRKQFAKTLGVLQSEMVTAVCDYCGKEYQVSAADVKTSRFCSNKCKTAYRYHAGLDNVERICVVCGKPFTVNKYARTKTCSKECSVKLCEITKNSKRHQRE